MRPERLFAGLFIATVIVVSVVSSSIFLTGNLGSSPGLCVFPQEVLAVANEVEQSQAFMTAKGDLSLTLNSYDYEGPGLGLIVGTPVTTTEGTTVVTTIQYATTIHYPPSVNLDFFPTGCGENHIGQEPWMSVQVPQDSHGNYDASSASYQRHAGFWPNETTFTIYP